MNADRRERGGRRLGVVLGWCASVLGCADAASSSPAPVLAMTCREPLALHFCLSAPPLTRTSRAMPEGGNEVTEAADFNAVVAEVGHGPLPGADASDWCAGEAASFQYAVDGSGVDLFWVRLDQAGRQLWLSLGAASAGLPVAVGDEVSIHYAEITTNLLAGFGPDLRTLTLRNAASSDLLVWMSTSGDISQLLAQAPSELGLEQGEERCAAGCALGRSQYAIEVSLDGFSASIDQAEISSLGRWQVLNARSEVLTGNACDPGLLQDESSGPAQLSRVGVWRAPSE